LNIEIALNRFPVCVFFLLIRQ